MIKKYITHLPDGRESQTAILLGRPVTLIHGQVVNEGVLTQVYKSYFKPYNEQTIQKAFNETPKPVVKEAVVKEEPKEEIISEVQDAGDILLSPEENLNETKENQQNHRNNKKRK